MEGTASAGMTGLTHNVNKRESAQRDMATYEKLVNMKKQSEAEEQQAALIEQQYYERLRKEAEQMLAGDRKAINEKSKSIQSQIRSQIRAFGGSRAKFMANGGMALIGDYTNNVLDSDEVQTYKQNKINLEKILDIKEKKMGHLLTENDKQSLKDYETNGSGTITYAGLMNEIVIPDANKFEFGTYTIPSDILRNGDNFIRILANYQLENPDYDPGSESQDKVWKRMLAYTAQKGWSQRGTHESKYTTTTTGRSTGTKKSGTDTEYYSDQEKTIAGETFFLYPRNSPDVALSKMGAGTKDLNQEQRETAFSEVFGNTPYTKTSKTDMTWGIAIANVFTGTLKDNENVYRPRDAKSLGDSMAMPLWQTQNGVDHVVENGVIKDVNIMGLKNLFDANGERIVDKGDMKTGSLRVIGAFDGWRMTGVDGETLVMDAMTEDGKFDKDRTDSLYQTEEGVDEPTGQRGLFIALQNDDGDVFYQRIDMNGIQQKNILAQRLGEGLNTITEEVSEAGRMERKMNEKREAVDIRRNGQARLEVHQPTFLEDINFQEQVKAYNYYNPQGNNRSSLMKSFYMSQYDHYTTPDDQGKVTGTYDINKQIEKNDFGTFISALGLEREVMDTRLSDRNFLDIIREKILTDQNSESPSIRRNNLILLEKMKQYLIKSNQIKR